MTNDGTAFTANGGTYTLRYGFNAICAIETELDISVAEIGQVLGDKPRLGTLRTIFGAGLIHEGKPVADADVGGIIDAIGIERAIELQGEAFALAFPEPAKAAPRPRARVKA